MIQSRQLISKTYFWMLEFHTLIVNKPWKFYPDVSIWNKIFFYSFSNNCAIHWRIPRPSTKFRREKLTNSNRTRCLEWFNFSGRNFADSSRMIIQKLMESLNDTKQAANFKDILLDVGVSYLDSEQTLKILSRRVDMK